MAAPAIDIYEDSFSEDSFEIDNVSPARPAAVSFTKKDETIEVVKRDDVAFGGSKPYVQQLPIAEQEGGKPDDEEEVSSEEEESEDSDETKSTSSTVECLSRDPLFLVLSNFLMATDAKKGSITDALFSINKSLKKIAKLLEKK
jgi:hypothetical protein